MDNIKSVNFYHQTFPVYLTFHTFVSLSRILIFFFFGANGSHLTSFLLFYLLLGVSRVPGVCIHLPAACPFPTSVTPIQHGWVQTSVALETLVFALGCSTIHALKLNMLIAGFLEVLTFYLFAV